MNKLYCDITLLFYFIERSCKRLSASMKDYESEAKYQTTITIDCYLKES